MDRFRKFAYLIVGLAMAGAFAVACDSGTQEPAAPDSPIPSVTIEDTAQGSPAVIPGAMRDDVPVYPGAVATSTGGTGAEGTSITGLSLTTKDAPEKVYDYYVENLESEGWAIEKKQGSSGQNSLSGMKGGCKLRMIVVPSEDGGSNMIMTTECP
jgi:hypothetical protein